MKAIIVHGAGGYPGENWFPWLKGELEKRGWQVDVPQFPTAEGSTLQDWLRVMEKRNVDEETVLIGHSLGVPFILTILETRRARAAILTGGFYEPLGNEFDGVITTFVGKDFDWEAIRKHAGRFVVINGDDDPYVRLELAEHLARKLGVDLEIIKKGGHLNEEAGFTSFLRVLELCESLE